MGYHPAYEKYMNAQKRKQQYQQPPMHHQFAFQPFSPANSQSMNVPNYPQPIHHNYPSPIMSTNMNESSTHSNHKFNKKHLQQQYKGPNSHNTLFSPDIDSRYDVDNHTVTSNVPSSSDYNTSHAHTYHPAANQKHHNIDRQLYHIVHILIIIKEIKIKQKGIGNEQIITKNIEIIIRIRLNYQIMAAMLIIIVMMQIKNINIRMSIIGEESLLIDIVLMSLSLFIIDEAHDRRF